MNEVSDVTAGRIRQIEERLKREGKIIDSSKSAKENSNGDKSRIVKLENENSRLGRLLEEQKRTTKALKEKSIQLEGKNRKIIIQNRKLADELERVSERNDVLLRKVADLEEKTSTSQDDATQQGGQNNRPSESFEQLTDLREKVKQEADRLQEKAIELMGMEKRLKEKEKHLDRIVEEKVNEEIRKYKAFSS